MTSKIVGLYSVASCTFPTYPTKSLSLWELLVVEHMESIPASITFATSGVAWWWLATKISVSRFWGELTLELFPLILTHSFLNVILWYHGTAKHLIIAIDSIRLNSFQLFFFQTVVRSA